MKKINFILITYLLFASFLTSCQSVKDGLTGKKSENSDEFLVQKKNPLVTPPKFMELLKPKTEKFEDEIVRIEEETDVEKLFKSQSDSKEKSSKKYGNAEEFVLENIR